MSEPSPSRSRYRYSIEPVILWLNWRTIAARRLERVSLSDSPLTFIVRTSPSSSDWVLEHVRAGKETVRDEIESFGFEFDDEIDLLDSNYVIRFRRP